MGRISNCTNSEDPQFVMSRIFVGNLNTFTLGKENVEAIFRRYGRIIGISMHKGYAFVQYTTEFEARSAVQGEDQRVYASQPIDVNMSAEPKPNRPSRKRGHSGSATAPEWDYYYNAPVVPQRGVPCPIPPTAIKRPRTELFTAVPMVANGLKQPRPIAVAAPRPFPVNGGRVLRTQPLSPNLKFDIPDVLVCGNCRTFFSDVDELIEHKRQPCRGRFACNKCDSDLNGMDTATFICARCSNEYVSCWELVQHVQSDHNLEICSSTPSITSSETASSPESNVDMATEVVAAEPPPETKQLEEDEDINKKEEPIAAENVQLKINGAEITT